MPLVGGSGAGNTAGGNPAGTGTSLNFIRTENKILAFGYSGVISVNNASVKPMLNFTIGNEALEMQLTAYSTHASAHGDDIQITINVDSQLVGRFIIESTNTPNTPTFPLPFVFAPFSKIEVEATNLSGSSFRDIAVTLVGEAYA